MLLLLIALQAAAPSPKHTWIADIKAKRATLGKAPITVQGDVVDLRSTSPTAKFGYYRLIDASDPVGLLIRTNNLPKDGGAVRVRGFVASQQPPDGSLLLDEAERTQSSRRPVAALLLLGLSGLSFLTLAVLLVRAAIAERRYKISPPLWLLPDAGPYGKSGPQGSGPPGGPATTPALKYRPDLEESDRQEREQLGKKRRGLARLTLGSLGLTALSGAWLLISRPALAQVPAFIFIEANDLPVPAILIPVPVPDTTLLAQNRPAADSVPAPRSRRDSVPRRRDTTVAKQPTPVPDTMVAPPPTVVTPAPAPAPSPPPPPPAPVPAPSPAPRDPEVERTRASLTLGEAANSLVAAINDHKLTQVAVLLPEGAAGDLGRRERFMKLLRDYSPRASLGNLEAVSLTEGGAEARFAVSFSWRGDFGVDRRKTGHFLGTARREEAGWRFYGARLLDAVP